MNNYVLYNQPSMKRINPNTGKPFKRGDKREDGYIFSHYSIKRLKADGFYTESWNSPKSQKNKDKSTRERLNRKAEAAKKNPGKQRLNPKTGKKFMLGDYVDGKYFLGYDNRYIKLNGYVREIWGNWDTYHRFKIKNIKVNAHYRANKKGYKSDLTIDYLVDIFPKDFLCPALGIKMEWGNREEIYSSPSLDRIIPSKGYKKGNVVWISQRANSIKLDASYDEIINVGKWLKNEHNKR